MRYSPIHPWLEKRQPEWREVGGMPVALRLQPAEVEQQAMRVLALCDLSCLSKLGVKGRDSQSWLESQQVEVPQRVYESCHLADGGFVVRLATDEFLLESGIANESVPALTAQLDSASGSVYSVARQEATFLLIGLSAVDVLAQTCGIDFHQAVRQRLVMTRVAGASCGVLPDPVADIWACRLWIDCSYASYLWEALVEISDSLGGSVVGAGCIFPELQ